MISSDKSSSYFLADAQLENRSFTILMNEASSGFPACRN
jgi:hypothetical protein